MPGLKCYMHYTIRYEDRPVFQLFRRMKAEPEKQAWVLRGNTWRAKRNWTWFKFWLNCRYVDIRSKVIHSPHLQTLKDLLH